MPLMKGKVATGKNELVMFFENYPHTKQTTQKVQMNAM